MSRKTTLPIQKYLMMSHRRIKNLPRKSVISRFADKVGLIYFGAVNQHTDEHKLVRGLTVSSAHRDNHFCIGTIGGYNVSLVNRSDFRKHSDGSDVLHEWLIFAIDLKTKAPIPHFFIGANNTDQNPYAALFSTFPNMKEVELGAFETYNDDFISRFTVYARPTKSQKVHHMISTDIAAVLGAHFWPLFIEQHNNVLYLYSTHEKITSDLLGSMLENGLWLASQLDERAEIDNQD